MSLRALEVLEVQIRTLEKVISVIKDPCNSSDRFYTLDAAEMDLDFLLNKRTEMNKSIFKERNLK